MTKEEQLRKAFEAILFKFIRETHSLVYYDFEELACEDWTIRKSKK